jgi:hypothetical protein
MSSDSSPGKVTALDFATHNVWGDKLSAFERSECVDTIRELLEAFGAAEILSVIAQLGITPKEESVGEAVMQALRAYSLLILESDRSKLTAALVGKLVKLELCTGKRIDLRQLGRENNISKQAVSNRMKLYAARLKLPRPDSKPENRDSHRLMNRRNYNGSRHPQQPALAHQ